MRLIDADKLMEEWNKQSSRGHYEFDQTIMEQPTAYDVEAKVAELENASVSVDGYCETEEMIPLANAISIVRGKE